MKGIFVINSLSGGGAEKVFSKLMKMIDSDQKRQYDMEVIILDEKEELYSLPESITIHRLGNKFGVIGQTYRYIKLIKMIQPDFVVSFLFRSNWCNIIGAKLFNYKSLLSERGNTNARLRGEFLSLKKMIIKFVFSGGDTTICVSKGVGDCLKNDYGISPDKISILNNSYNLVDIRNKAKCSAIEGLEPGYILAIGRLVKLKGFDDLITAFSKSKLSRELVILGDGEELESLKLHAKDAGIGDRVKFLGFVSNPYPYMGSAHSFVLSSHFEGFPNAMVEAMSLCKPVISSLTDGPVDILQPSRLPKHGEFETAKYGLVYNAKDKEALTKALDEVNDNQGLYRELCMLSEQRAEHYSEDKFYTEFNTIVRNYVPGFH